MLEMYKGLVNSPETTITNNISTTDTIIYVLDPARVPELPNLLTIGTGTNAETVKVLSIDGNALTVQRGFQGIAKDWLAGTVVARNFTEYDYNTLKENIEDLEANKETPAGAQAKIDDLAGAGRTTETVKGNADDLATHKADYAQHMTYATASGTNTYTATIAGIAALAEGLSVKIKFTNANTGASTLNINGLGAKALQKSNGSALSGGNIKAGQIAHLAYTGSVFQLLGEGGEYGTAEAAQVLAPYTIGTEDGIVAGTMPDQGAKIITPTTINQAIQAGYHNGSGYVQGDADLIPGNILSGKTIFDVAGTLLKGAEIKSVQYGTWEASGVSTKYVTINTVDRSKSILIFTHWGGNTFGGLRGFLNTDSQICFTLPSDATSMKCSWFVIEFNSGVSVQYGTGSTKDVKDVTISAVDMSKCFVIVSSNLSSVGSQTMGHTQMVAELTSTTNLRLDRAYNSSFSVNYAYQVVTFT